MFLAKLHKVDQPYAKYGYKFGYVQQISTQVQDIIYICFNFPHFPSTYGCESQMSQLGDLIPPLMMMSWALEAPMIFDLFLDQSATYVSKPTS